MSNESTVIDALEEDSFESAIDFDKKVHPWRICPIGTHLVKEHPLHVPPSKKHPDGMITTRHQHCANNPSKKDLLSFDEIQHMTETCFEKLVGPPAKDVLTEFPNADKYDKQIRGWVRYWNEIFYPTGILNGNLVKPSLQQNLVLIQQVIIK